MAAVASPDPWLIALARTSQAEPDARHTTIRNMAFSSADGHEAHKFMHLVKVLGGTGDSWELPLNSGMHDHVLHAAI